MRALGLIMSGIGTILTAAPAQAQTYDPRYPICLQSCALGGCKIECDYTSLTQCNASASGRAAQCLINPFFPLAHQQSSRGRGHRRPHRLK
jgi:Protein of unknown function (DUF3551)